MILLWLALALQDGDWTLQPKAAAAAIRSTVRQAEDFRVELKWTAVNPGATPATLTLELLDDKTLETLHVESVGVASAMCPPALAGTFRRTFLFWNAKADTLRFRLVADGAEGSRFDITGLKFEPCTGTDPEKADVASLIGKLDHEDIAARDAAEKDLAKFGCKAMSQLRDAMAAPETETSARAGTTIGRRAVHVNLADQRETWRGVAPEGATVVAGDDQVEAKSTDGGPITLWREAVAKDFVLDAAWAGWSAVFPNLNMRFEVRDPVSGRLIFDERIGALGG